MLDSTLRERATALILVKTDDRHKRFIGDAGRSLGQSIEIGRSGKLIRELHRAHELEVEVRAVLCWESIVRVHKAFGEPFSDSLRDDLKSFFDTALKHNSDNLVDCLAIFFDGIKAAAGLNLDEAIEETAAKYHVEIDLYVDSLSAARSKSPPSATNTYSFHGNVGAVQTGASAVAHVVQNIGTEDRAALLEALAQTQAVIAADKSLPAPQREELIAVAEKCAAEVNSKNPNNTILFAMLTALGTTVQSIAAGQPAYEALKVAVLALGITLP